MHMEDRFCGERAGALVDEAHDLSAFHHHASQLRLDGSVQDDSHNLRLPAAGDHIARIVQPDGPVYQCDSSERQQAGAVDGENPRCSQDELFRGIGEATDRPEPACIDDLQNDDDGEEKLQHLMARNEDAGEDDEDDVDFNPLAQLSPSCDASTIMSSEGDDGGEVEQVAEQPGEEEEQHFDEEDDLVELGSEVEEEEYNYEEEDDDEGHGQAKYACQVEGEEAEVEAQGGGQDVAGGVGDQEFDAPSPSILPIDTHDALTDPQLPVDGGLDHNLLEDQVHTSDAISKRTRAHYSLTDMSLDQLETFLQESDEEDYFPNVDDQEEYRKFLAAVLEEGESKSNGEPKNESVLEEDDDEDDEDFELEIEEALESDREDKNEARSRRRRHRIETREKRRERSRRQRKERLLGVGTSQLRHLVPYVGFAPDTQSSLHTICSSDATNLAAALHKKIPVNGFTAHQIGQLHCLIHEHLQLLIQVFSLCILEPSRQQVAIDTHKMLVEMVEKRDTILSWKETAFPDFCFRPPYIHPSVTEPCNSGSSDLAERLPGESECLSRDTGDDSPIAKSTTEPSSDPRYPSPWVPSTSGPVRSLLDVAPISMVRQYLTQIAAVVQDYRQRHVESGSYHSECERETLFASSVPLPPGAESQKQQTSWSTSGSGSEDAGGLSSLKPHVKKTMAAALVESTKRQCIALVPKGVAKAIQPFRPLFNPAFFPHKPPPAATANRLLFTDSEDELLAMGLMTYNTDWKAIQQRFLPSKTMHQIFVRQKNRSSARAPENSIKAVRRLKSSTLTATERASIHEALRFFRFDWAKVWQHSVPYRDPAILPRQWRIAQGIQKSHKTRQICKERCRSYEANRRCCSQSKKRVASIASQIVKVYQGPSGIAACAMKQKQHPEDSCGSRENDLIQDAFLADWKPYSSQTITAAVAALSDAELASNGRTKRKRMKVQTAEQVGNRTVQMRTTATGSEQCAELSPIPSLPFYPGASFRERLPHNQSYGVHSRRKLAIRTVKLSPDLPSVNLPPHVRVLSQFTVQKPPSSLPLSCTYRGLSLPRVESPGSPWPPVADSPCLNTMCAQTFDPAIGMHVQKGYKVRPPSGSLTAKKVGRQAGTVGAKAVLGGDEPIRNSMVGISYDQVAGLDPHVCRPSWSTDADIQGHPSTHGVSSKDFGLSHMNSSPPGYFQQAARQQVVPRFHPFFCTASTDGAGSSFLATQASRHPSVSTLGASGAVGDDSRLKEPSTSAVEGERSNGKSCQVLHGLCVAAV